MQICSYHKDFGGICVEQDLTKLTAWYCQNEVMEVGTNLKIYSMCSK